MPSLYFLAKVTYTLHSCKFREVILGSRIILLALVKSQRHHQHLAPQGGVRHLPEVPVFGRIALVGQGEESAPRQTLQYVVEVGLVMRQ